MPDTPETPEAAESTESTFDVGAAAEKIAGELFPPEPTEEAPEAEPDSRETAPEPRAEPKAEPKVEPVAARPVPKTWPKEMHEHWSKVDPAVQDYWNTREEQMLQGIGQYKDEAAFGKALREVINPYQAMITAQGLDAPKAVSYLLNAHYKLSNASEAERGAYFSELAKTYGVDLSKVAPAAQMPPELKSLHDELNSIKSQMRTREQAAVTQAQAQIRSEVEKFASDPAHPYFEDVADDIVPFLQAGADLQTAYEKAVWANPITRAKEQARQTAEAEAKRKENARLDALKSRPAAATNVRSRDTNRTPTEPVGTMEDTMKRTLAEIRSRASP